MATVQKRMVGLMGEQDYPALRALVARLPEAQLPTYCSEWQRETGVVVSIKTTSHEPDVGAARPAAKKRPSGQWQWSVTR